MTYRRKAAPPSSDRKLRRLSRLRVPFQLAAFATLAAVICSTNTSLADERGLAFWLAGEFGSLAAAPLVPGWAIALIERYNPVSGGGNVAAARQVTINKLPLTLNVNLNASLKANPNLVLASPTYVFATPVLGGQLHTVFLAEPTFLFARECVRPNGDQISAAQLKRRLTMGYQARV